MVLYVPLDRPTAEAAQNCPRAGRTQAAPLALWMFALVSPSFPVSSPEQMSRGTHEGDPPDVEAAQGGKSTYPRAGA